MPGMNADYRNAVANHGAGLATHIGLVNNVGAELAGGAPAYARMVSGWVGAIDGTVQLAANLLFNIPAGTNVAGWRAYSAGILGTDYGGKALLQEDYAGQGTYTLEAVGTYIEHKVAP